jgi:hypothetical protein
MSKRLGAVEKFWIAGHIDKLSPSDMAKTLGVSVRSIQSAIAKIKGLNREGEPKGTPEQQTLPTEQPVTKEEKQKQEVMRKEPGLRLDAIFDRRNSSGELSGAVSMTPVGAMIGDDIASGKMGPIPSPFADKTRVHKIREDK